MHANDNIQDGDITKALWDIRMYKDVVSSYKEKSVPATCAKNHQRIPIDSIWTSPGLTVLQCGFLPFHDTYGVQSDHQLVWADICNKDLLSHRPQHIYRTLCTKSRSNNPDVREKLFNAASRSMVMKMSLTISKHKQTFVSSNGKGKTAEMRLSFYTKLWPLRLKRFS